MSTFTGGGGGAEDPDSTRPSGDINTYWWCEWSDSGSERFWECREEHMLLSVLIWSAEKIYSTPEILRSSFAYQSEDRRISVILDSQMESRLRNTGVRAVIPSCYEFSKLVKDFPPGSQSSSWIFKVHHNLRTTFTQTQDARLFLKTHEMFHTAH